jgi:hypothetical protein
MKYVSITGKDHFEEHPIDNDVIEYAASITSESHNMEHPNDLWVVSVRDPDSITDNELKMADKISKKELPEIKE